MTGCTGGELYVWSIPNLSSGSRTHSIPITNARRINPKPYTSPIDGVRFVNNRIISKTASGRIDVWDSESYEVIFNLIVRLTSDVTFLVSSNHHIEKSSP